MTVASYVFLSLQSNEHDDSSGSGWAWGTFSTTILSAGSSRNDATGSLLNAGLANVSQLLFSIGYLTFNGLFTCIAQAAEWDHYALKRKSLRVTRPQGKQRSTYFLQLPFRFAVPLTALSGIIHWLMSQSLFLVRVDIQDRTGNLLPDLSTSACGFSTLSFLILCIVFTLLLFVVLAFALRRWRLNMPLAGSCSLVISAACHPGRDEIDPHLKAVQWGVVNKASGDGIGHCSFSADPVEELEPGKKYA
jgi:hypothetical protein